MILSVENVYKSYSLQSKDDTPILKGVSFSVSEGEYVSLIGPSGAGKSTLLHLIGTLDTVDSGSIHFRYNKEMVDLTKQSQDVIAQLRNKEIGFVFQFHHLLPEFSALENIFLPSIIAGNYSKQQQKKAEHLMESLGILHRKGNKPHELSGGEQQRVAIARALFSEPSILLADEPTGNLDSANTENILQLFDEIRSKHSLTIIVATHSEAVAKRTQRTITLKDGLIV